MGTSSAGTIAYCNVRHVLQTSLSSRVPVAPRWRIVPDAAPAVCRWSDEYVAHHALSNDTYRLSATAGQILTELMAAETGRAVDMGNTASMEAADAERSLSALAELGFITQC